MSGYVGKGWLALNKPSWIGIDLAPSPSISQTVVQTCRKHADQKKPQAQSKGKS